MSQLGQMQQVTGHFISMPKVREPMVMRPHFYFPIETGKAKIIFLLS